MAKRMTVRQFLALGPNEQPSVMAAEALWNDIGTLKDEVARLKGELAAVEKELASAPPSPRIRRMDRILHPKGE